MATSADLQILIDATAEGMRRELQRAEGELKRFSKQTDRELQGVDAAFAKLGGSIRAVFAGITVTAAVSGLASLTQAALDSAGRIDDARQKAGVTAEEYQRLAYAAKQSGVEAATLDRALRQLNLNLAEGKVKATSVQDAMLKVADAVMNAKDGTEAAAIVTEAYGKAGVELIPMLNQGASGLIALTEAADRLGVVLSNETIAASAEFGDRLDDLKMVLTAIVQGALLDTLTKHTGDLAAIVRDEGFQNGLRMMASGIAAVGGAALESIAAIGQFGLLVGEVTTGDFSGAYDRLKAASDKRKSERGEWVGSAGSLADESRAEGLVIELTKPAGLLHSGGALFAPDKKKKGAKAKVDPDIAAGKSIAEAVRTPAEKAAAEIANLNRLMAKGAIDAETLDRAFVKAINDMDKALESPKIDEAKRLWEATLTPAEKYRLEVEKINEVLDAGSETHRRALEKAGKDLDKALLDADEDAKALKDAAEDLGMTFTSAFEDAIVAGKGFRDILDGLLQDILRISIRMTVTRPLTGALTEFLGGTLGGLFGGGGGLVAAPGSSSVGAQMGAIRGAFASGGWVRGPGTGTSDSILARVSAGEYIVPADIARMNRSLLENLPKFSAGGFVGPAPAGGGGNLQVVLENKSSQPLKLESQRHERGPDGKQIVKILVVDAFRDALRAGELDNSMRSRYGAAVQPIAR